MSAVEEQVSALRMYWRAGREKPGRTIYAQLGPGPSEADFLIGMMDSNALAVLVVDTHNKELLESTNPLPRSA
jgi:hypothetical protein